MSYIIQQSDRNYYLKILDDIINKLYENLYAVTHIRFITISLGL